MSWSALLYPVSSRCGVDQQSANDSMYVSTAKGYATQFRLAAQYGTVGLLAHNYLAGASFATLPVGRELDLIYGDGSIRRFSIAGIRRFQAINPHDAASDLLDLDHGNARLSSTDAFYQIYGAGNRVVLQTCIVANGDPFWGRVFVIALSL